MQSNTVIVDNSSYINNFMKFFIPFCLIQFKTICTGKPNFLFKRIAKISTPPVEALAFKINPIPTPTKHAAKIAANNGSSR